MTSFEENIEQIDLEIRKRRSSWNLSSIQHMDYDDVSQIVRIHIYEKWHLYDQSKPLGPWLNTIISHQIKNLVRNLYSNYARPCLKCYASIDDGCKIYIEQCNKCPLYAFWEKSRKNAYEIKIPLPIENHLNEHHEMFQEEGNIESAAKNIHDKMHEILKPKHWNIYKMLFIEQLSEEEIAFKLGYIEDNENRKQRYNKQIKNIRKILIVKVKHLISKDEVDI